ncbi:MAG: hypothetical protein GXO65_07545 [Euryarchaeota archaeon]|nr:hypothetical protein [Euryarchaeota archaeon]
MNLEMLFTLFYGTAIGALLLTSFKTTRYREDMYKIAGAGLLVWGLAYIVKYIFVLKSIYGKPEWALAELIEILGILFMTLGITYGKKRA